MAQGLRRGHTNTVALLVGDIAQRHFAELTMHVQAALEEIGASLMLFNLGHSATRLLDFLERAPSMKLRGVAIALSDTVPAARRAAARGPARQRHRGRVDRTEPHALRRCRPSSTKSAPRRSARSTYLLAKGHRRVAYVGRIKGSAVGSERFRGYRAALQGAGLFDEALVFDLAFRYAAGRDAILRARERGLAFTAVQGGSDEIAMGALAALRDAGLRVPEDVAIVGFGDIEMGAYLRPALTTLSSHPADAARHLRDLLKADARAVAGADPASARARGTGLGMSAPTNESCCARRVP